MKRFQYFMLSVVFTSVVGLSVRVNAAEDTWTYKANMPTARGFVSGCVLDGRLYVVGGFPSHYSVTAAVEMYDPTTDTWTKMADMPAGRCGHATCALDGKIYVFGGTSPDPYAAAQKNVYVYDPKTNTWMPEADMPYAIALCGVAVVDGMIYLVGGTLSASSSAVATLMAYDPVTESWVRRADMPTARAYLSACSVGGKIYAIGGAQNYQTPPYGNVEVYDPATNTWTRQSDMLTARAGVSTCVVDRKIYACGGFSSTGVHTANELYDPIADIWMAKAPMQQKRLVPFAGSVGDRVYVIGGSYPDSQGQPVVLPTTEEYDTGLVRSPDFDGDWHITIDDLIVLIEHWGQADPLCDIAPRPFGDGVVDENDLEVLMSYWGQEIPNPALIAHWRLDETDGTLVTDSVGTADGRVIGDPIWQPTGGKIAGALEFDGVDDCVTTGFVCDPSKGLFSVFAWVKGGAPGQVIVSQEGGVDWLMAAALGALATELKSSRGGPLISSTVITDGSWHRVGAIRDGADRILYVDDVEVAREAVPGIVGTTGGLYIGGGSTLAPGTFWSGLIDDVRIYNGVVRP